VATFFAVWKMDALVSFLSIGSKAVIIIKGLADAALAANAIGGLSAAFGSLQIGLAAIPVSAGLAASAIAALVIEIGLMIAYAKETEDIRTKAIEDHQTYMSKIADKALKMGLIDRKQRNDLRQMYDEDADVIINALAKEIGAIEHAERVKEATDKANKARSDAKIDDIKKFQKDVETLMNK